MSRSTWREEQKREREIKKNVKSRSAPPAPGVVLGKSNIKEKEPIPGILWLVEADLLKKNCLWEPHLLRLIEELADTKTTTRKTWLRRATREYHKHRLSEKPIEGSRLYPELCYTDDGTILIDNGIAGSTDCPGCIYYPIEAFEYNTQMVRTHIHNFPSCHGIAKRKGNYWLLRRVDSDDDKFECDRGQIAIYSLEALENKEREDQNGDPLPDHVIPLPVFRYCILTDQDAIEDLHGNWIISINPHQQTPSFKGELYIATADFKETYTVDTGLVRDTRSSYGVFRDLLYIQSQFIGDGSYGIDECRFSYGGVRRIPSPCRRLSGAHRPPPQKKKIIGTNLIRRFRLGWSPGVFRGNVMHFNVDPNSGMIMVVSTLKYHREERLEIELMDPELIHSEGSSKEERLQISPTRNSVYIISTKETSHRYRFHFNSNPKWGHGIIGSRDREIYFF